LYPAAFSITLVSARTSFSVTARAAASASVISSQIAWMLSQPNSLAARQRRSPETSSYSFGDRGRTKIGVLKPVARSDSISSFCFASSN
jgi:hypothetical protein